MLKKLHTALLAAKKMLASKSETPDLDTELLLAEALGKPRSFLFARPEYLLSPQQEKRFGVLLQKRMLGHPVAQILGWQEFFGRDFLVTEDVLIPRPESEMLIEHALPLLQNGGTVIDVGTGSGCLAITLALESAAEQVVAIDISEKALEMAEKNAEKYELFFTPQPPLEGGQSPLQGEYRGLKAEEEKFENPSKPPSVPPYQGGGVLFLHNDLLTNLSFEIFPEPLIFIANLPYVPEGERHPSVAKEPEGAIYSGIDGLDHYRRFFAQLQKIASPAAGLAPLFQMVCLFEFHPTQKEELETILQELFPDAEISFYKDLAGLWRMGSVNYELRITNEE